MPHDNLAPVKPGQAVAELNARLDALNINLASGFNRLDDHLTGLGTAPAWCNADLASAISEHLDSIGLDDINSNRT